MVWSVIVVFLLSESFFFMKSSSKRISFVLISMILVSFYSLALNSSEFWVIVRLSLYTLFFSSASCSYSLSNYKLEECFSLTKKAPPSYYVLNYELIDLRTIWVVWNLTTPIAPSYTGFLSLTRISTTIRCFQSHFLKILTSSILFFEFFRC